MIDLLIDTRGCRILKIMNSCKEARLPAPNIIEKDGGILVELYKESGQVGGQVDKTTIKLTNRQQDVLDRDSATTGNWIVKIN